jgi:restriction endonuclease S subunit
MLLPISIEEQNDIAEFLEPIDGKIKLLQIQIDELEKWKK